MGKEDFQPGSKCPSYSICLRRGTCNEADSIEGIRNTKPVDRAQLKAAVESSDCQHPEAVTAREGTKNSFSSLFND